IHPKQKIHRLINNKTDTLDFNIEDIKIKELEEKILEHPMVANAEVYMSIDGILGAEITQRTPVGRCINKDGVMYIDELGDFMPLSTNHSARVPLVYGVRDSLTRVDIMPLLLAIREDEYMKQCVVSVVHNKTDDIHLVVRQKKISCNIVH